MNETDRLNGYSRFELNVLMLLLLIVIMLLGLFLMLVTMYVSIYPGTTLIEKLVIKLACIAALWYVLYKVEKGIDKMKTRALFPINKKE